MSKEEREFLDQLRARSVEAAAEILEGIQRLRALYDEVTDDGTGAGPARPRAADFFYRLARTELEHASNVIRLGNAQAELIFDHVRQLARRRRGAAAEPPAAVVLLEPTATGDGYAAAFDVRNPFRVEADVRFELAPLRTASGEPAAGPPGADPPRVRAACAPARVPAAQVGRVELTLAPAGAVAETLFGEVVVVLSGEVERPVARRALKVRPRADGAQR